MRSVYLTRYRHSSITTTTTTLITIDIHNNAIFVSILLLFLLNFFLPSPSQHSLVIVTALYYLLENYASDVQSKLLYKIKTTAAAT